MRGSGIVRPLVAGLAIALTAAGCGGSASVTGPEEGSASGSAVLQGGIVGVGFSASATGSLQTPSSGSGMRVSVVGTALSTEADEEGRFLLSGLAPGTATLRFEAAGVDARLTVSGLLDGQVLSIQVHVSGGAAELAGSPNCAPSAETYFSGLLESKAGTLLVVGGRTVDASAVRKVWRGDRRIDLAELRVGEKVKVWGMLRGDGVVMAEEIAALTGGGATGTATWVTFSGTVESLGASSLDVHQSPYSSFPVLVIKGRKVKTNASTRFKWSDDTVLDPTQIKVGDKAYVEGWLKPEGHVLATKLVVDCR